MNRRGLAEMLYITWYPCFRCVCYFKLIHSAGIIPKFVLSLSSFALGVVLSLVNLPALTHGNRHLRDLHQQVSTDSVYIFCVVNVSHDRGERMRARGALSRVRLQCFISPSACWSSLDGLGLTLVLQLPAFLVSSPYFVTDSPDLTELENSHAQTNFLLITWISFSNWLIELSGTLQLGEVRKWWHDVIL